MLNKRKAISYALTTAFLFTTFTFLPSMKAAASTSTTISRLSGDDRYATAIKISQRGWTEAQNIVLTTGDDFPDALCAAPLARKLNAPILLNRGTGLDSRVEAQIKALGAKNVYVIGGEKAVSGTAVSKLAGYGINVNRLYGSDRYGTSIAVASFIASKFGPVSSAVLVTGNDFPDALSIAPIAASKGMVILLSPKNNLLSSEKTFIIQSSISNAYIIGGTGVITDNVKNGLPVPSARLGGNDRYETNVLIINQFINDLKLDETYMATGSDFPDALAGSALAPANSSPILLTNGVPDVSMKEFLHDNFSRIGRITILGGEKAISTSAVKSMLSPYINFVGNSLSNLNSFGLASVQGDWIYYSNLSDSQKLYKMKFDGSMNTKVMDDKDISHINVVGDWIYYSDSIGRMCRVSLNGSQKSVVVNESTYFMYVTSDWIYYYTDGLYRMIPGGTPQKLVSTDNPWNFYIDEGSIYYMSGGKLFMTGQNGGQGNAVIQDNIIKFNISDGYIFYMTINNELYRANMDGSARVKVADDIMDINVQGDIIYYINSSNGSLYSMKQDGSTNTCLTSRPAYGNINIAGGRIFFGSIDTSFNMYKVNSDGTGKAVVGDKYAASIKYSDGWVYYMSASGDNEIFRMKQDGSDNTDLKISSSGNMDVSGGYIYYTDIGDFTIYRANADGTGAVQLSEIPSYEVKADGEWIYFSNLYDGGKLYKMKSDGSCVTKVSSNEASLIIIDGSYVYYFKEGTITESNGESQYTDCGIYRININGDPSSEVKLSSDYIEGMYISGGYLYYHGAGSFDGSSKDSIKSIKLDTLEQTNIAASSTAFSVGGGKVYRVDSSNLNSIIISDINGNAIGSISSDDPVGSIYADDSGNVYFMTIHTASKLYTITTDGKYESVF